MMDEHAPKAPELFPIAGGWAAYGDGWAVHGTTRQEALENYWKAEQRRREILAMPPWFEQVKRKKQDRKDTQTLPESL